MTARLREFSDHFAETALRVLNPGREPAADVAAAGKAKRGLLIFQGMDRRPTLLQLIGVRSAKIDRRRVTV